MGDDKNAARYCLDTNVVSDILRGHEGVAKRLAYEMSKNSDIFVRSIVYYEITRGMKASKAIRRLNEFHRFYAKVRHLFFDRDSMEVIDKAAEIYAYLHKGHQIEDNDVYIAAIALVNDCVLVTDNEKHFSRVPGLSL